MKKQSEKQLNRDRIIQQAGRWKDVLELKPSGRFPANLICSDDVLNDGRDNKSGWRDKDHQQGRSQFGIGNTNGKEYGQHYLDSGSFSRYFDLDAWARENGFPEPDLFGERKQSPVDTFPFLIVSKASKREKNKRLDGCIIRQSIGGGGTNNTSDNVCGKFGSIKAPAQNSHPTVKPLKLMHYLITLTTREGDLVVDPYVGSGTVSLAAKQLGRHFIGIEISEAYSEIARTRLAQEVLKTVKLNCKEKETER